MQDLMDIELQAFATAQRRLPTPSGPRSRAATRAIRRPPRKAATRKPISPRARQIIAVRLARALAPILDQVARRALLRKSGQQGEQIDLPDIAHRIRQFKARLYGVLIGPVAMAIAQNLAMNPPTSPSSVAIKVAIALATDQAKTMGLVDEKEGAVINGLAPKAVEEVLPEIFALIRRAGESEEEDALEAELRIFS